MRNGAWFVMFAKDHLPPEAEIKAALAKVRNVSVTKTAHMEFSVAAGKASFVVTLNDKSWVAAETKEAVERNGGSLSNRAQVAKYDARFELLFEQSAMGDLFAPILSAAEKLAKLTKGVIYEVDNGVFQ
jgi:hypothetical protein